MYFSKKLKNFKNLEHCFFLEMEEFLKEFTVALIVALDQTIIEKMFLKI